MLTVSPRMETALWRWFRFNPCLAVRDIQSRRRGGWGKALHVVAVLISGGALLYVVAEGWSSLDRTPPEAFRDGFAGALSVLASGFVLIVGGLAAAGIAVERERRTLETLAATLLTPADLVTGKVLGVLDAALVMMAWTAPVALVALLAGGVSIVEVALCYGALLLAACRIAIVGALVSAFAASTLASLIGTFAALAILAALPNTFMMICEFSMLASSADEIGLGPAALICVAWASWTWLVARRIVAALWARRDDSGSATGNRGAGAGLVAGVLLLLALPVVVAGLMRMPSGVFNLLEPASAIRAVSRGFAESATGPTFAMDYGLHSIPAPLVWGMTYLFGVLQCMILWDLAVRSYGYSLHPSRIVKQIKG